MHKRNLYGEVVHVPAVRSTVFYKAVSEGAVKEQWSGGGAVKEQWRSSEGAMKELWKSSAGAVEEQWRSSAGAVE